MFPDDRFVNLTKEKNIFSVSPWFMMYVCMLWKKKMEITSVILINFWRSQQDLNDSVYKEAFVRTYLTNIPPVAAGSGKESSSSSFTSSKAIEPLTQKGSGKREREGEEERQAMTERERERESETHKEIQRCRERYREREIERKR